MQAEFCSLCFTPGDNLLEPIEEDARESLSLLFSHLGKDAKTRSGSQVACADCSTRLRGYLEFKSSFMQTHACLQSLGTEQRGALLDLGQVDLQNEGNGSEVSTKDLVVCRFCLKQATGAYTILVEDSKELSLVTIMMHTCFPGLELDTMSGHIICLPCHEALEESCVFIRSLDVENRIKEEEAVEEMEFEESPDLKPILLESETFPNGISCVDLNTVKKEEDSFTSNGDDFDGAVAKVEESVEQVDEQELDEKHNVKFEAVEEVDVVEHSLSSFDGDACDIEVEQITIESVSGKTSATLSETTCKSENSLYKTRRKANLKPPEVTIHKCAKCLYETKFKHTLTKHMLIHKKCGVCSFETSHKDKLRKRMFKHKKPSEVTIHKCEECLYGTRRKDSLKTHMLIHKKPSEVTIHKCANCSYETKHKSSLKTHMLIHKKPSQVTIHKCKECSYGTKHKNNLIKHMLIHKRPSETTTYKCNMCSLETKRKNSLKTHMLIHKKPSEVIIHKCEECSHGTKHKRSLKTHMLIHKNSSEVTIHKCVECSYGTKHKNNLIKHMIIHKAPSEVTIHKCEECSFETKHKGNLKVHMDIHKKPPRSRCRSMTGAVTKRGTNNSNK